MPIFNIVLQEVAIREGSVTVIADDINDAMAKALSSGAESYDSVLHSKLSISNVEEVVYDFLNTELKHNFSRFKNINTSLITLKYFNTSTHYGLSVVIYHEDSTVKKYFYTYTTEIDRQHDFNLLSNIIKQFKKD